MLWTLEEAEAALKNSPVDKIEHMVLTGGPGGKRHGCKYRLQSNSSSFVAKSWWLARILSNPPYTELFRTSKRTPTHRDHSRWLSRKELE